MIQSLRLNVIIPEINGVTRADKQENTRLPAGIVRINEEELVGVRNGPASWIVWWEYTRRTRLVSRRLGSSWVSPLSTVQESCWRVVGIRNLRRTFVRGLARAYAPINAIRGVLHVRTKWRQVQIQQAAQTEDCSSETHPTTAT